jgi:uncharacterized membrane protein
MNGLWQTIMDNVLFVVEFLGVVGCSFLLAYGIEKYSQSRRNVSEKIFTTRATTMIGMFSAIAFILFLVEFPLPFAPAFYQVDFSELPVLIGTFAFGPVAGVMIEFCKILIKLLIKGTGTAFVGELANFAVGSPHLYATNACANSCKLITTTTAKKLANNSTNCSIVLLYRFFFEKSSTQSENYKKLIKKFLIFSKAFAGYGRFLSNPHKIAAQRYTLLPRL